MTETRSITTCTAFFSAASLSDAVLGISGVAGVPLSLGPETALWSGSPGCPMSFSASSLVGTAFSSGTGSGGASCGH